jgi:hypothetical protein
MKILHLLAFLTVANLSSGQEQIELFGRVLAEEGTPVPGVDVIIQGTSNRVVTNICGEFKIIVPQSREGILSISLISNPFYFDLKKLKEKDLSKEIRFWMFRESRRKQNVNLSSACDLSRPVKVCALTYK